MSLSSTRRGVLTALVLGSLALPAVAAPLPADVPADSWASTAVANLTDKWQILALSPAGTFNGDQQVSRYELAETLWRVVRIVERRQMVDLSMPPPPRAFGDVEAQHEAAIEAVVNKYGLYEGLAELGKRRFDGGHSVQRYELAHLLHRLMQRADELKVAVTGKGPELNYKDVPARHWAAPLLHELTRRFGLLIGYPDGLYRGDQPLTRYELAIALNAALNNLLEKQFQASTAPVQPAAAPTPEPPPPAAARDLPGFELELGLKGGRHDDRDLMAGAQFDLGWWFGKVGETRPGLGVTGDYSLLFNRAAQPLVHAGAANAELRWRLTGVDSYDDPYLYLGAGYHGDAWWAPNLPLYHAHGLGLTVAGGLPTRVWDTWLVGRMTYTNYLFPDMAYAARLATGQQLFAGVEKRFGEASGLRLGYSGTLYAQFPTGGNAVFLPVNHGGLVFSGHWGF